MQIDEDVLREVEAALALYADQKYWQDGGFDFPPAGNVVELVPSTINTDHGKTAVSALAKLRKAMEDAQ